MHMKMMLLKLSLPSILLYQPPLHHLLMISAACWPNPSLPPLLQTRSFLPHLSTVQAADFTIPWTSRLFSLLLLCACSLAVLCSTFVLPLGGNLSPSARVSRVVVSSFAMNRMAKGGGV
jgi:hypothetical protein